MAEGRFTPGPWAVFGCGTLRTSWLEVKTADGKTTICKLKNNQLALANAIVAAPEMYEALRRRLDPGHISTIMEDEEDRRLLAKAEGRDV